MWVGGEKEGRKGGRASSGGMEGGKEKGKIEGREGEEVKECSVHTYQERDKRKKSAKETNDKWLLLFLLLLRQLVPTACLLR